MKPHTRSRFTTLTALASLIVLSGGSPADGNQQKVNSSEAALAKVSAASTEAEHLTAPATLKPIAESGDADAQFLLGWYRDVGPGPIDNAEAGRWYAKSADQGHALARARFGRLLLLGRGVLLDEERGYRLIVEALPDIRKKADAGDRIAQLIVAKSLANGIGVEQNVAEAIRYARQAAEKGLPQGQLLYAMGLLESPNPADAAKWLRAAAEQGDPTAMCTLARFNTTGEFGFERNESRSAELLKKAADWKYPEAQRHFGRLVLIGYSGVKRDAKEAARLFEVAARPERFTNSIGMSLTRIESGLFEVGITPPDEFRRAIDRMSTPEEVLMFATALPPKQVVNVERDYYVGTHEVTVGAFRRFVKDENYRTEAERDGKGGTGRLSSGEFGDHPQFTWQNYGFPVTDDHAVANVSWNDAKAFCAWLSKKEGRKYRLPTEQEWEKCAKGDVPTSFAFGEDLDVALHLYGNIADASLKRLIPGVPWTLSGDDSQPFLGPVGKYYPNPYGLYDIHGNVIEWCSTEFTFFGPVRDVVDVKWPEPASGLRYVHRGGNWFNRPILASTVSRSGSPPSFRNSLTGFRVVMETKR